MKNKTITIREYESVATDEQDEKKLNQQDFRELRDYALDIDNKKNCKIFKIHPFQKTITAQNYVGYIQTKNGLGLEILPKINLSSSQENQEYQKEKKIFIKMLSVFLNFEKFSEQNNADLDTLSQLPIWEALIVMFLKEVQNLTKKGIQKAYESKEENLPVWRGKLLFQQNIRHNLTNKARFYMRFDEYTANRAENRLVKSCLRFLQKYSHNEKNQQNIRRQLRFFNEVDFSENYDYDFELCQDNRLMKRYQKLLKWCKIFLKNKRFSPFGGSNLAISLLFPMEQIFEFYVGWCFQKYLAKDYKVTKQSTEKYLCQKNSFQIRPDFLLERKQHKKDNELREKFILDAKWKEFKQKQKASCNESKYNINQNDLYQVFAYSRVFDNSEGFDCKKVFLIYPQSKSFNKEITLEFNSNNKPICVCYPFDLENEEKSTKDLQSVL